MGQAGRIEVLLNAELLNQAQVLPEGADPGLLAPALAPMAMAMAPPGMGGAKPAHAAAIGLDEAIGYGYQTAFTSSTRAHQGHPLTGMDAKRNLGQAGLVLTG
jgi:hypothetical protein